MNNNEWSEVNEWLKKVDKYKEALRSIEVPELQDFRDSLAELIDNMQAHIPHLISVGGYVVCKIAERITPKDKFLFAKWDGDRFTISIFPTDSISLAEFERVMKATYNLAKEMADENGMIQFISNRKIEN